MPLSQQNRAEQHLPIVRRALQGKEAADLEVAARKARMPAGEAVAFVASYNLRAPEAPAAPGEVVRPAEGVGFPFPPPPPPPGFGGGAPGVVPKSTVFPLLPGLNRIGYDDHFGDFARPAHKSTESRQWIVLVVGRRAFVADDSSTNGSYVLRSGAARLSGEDPRFDAGCSGFRRDPESMVALDWAGTNVVELGEGDVLIACYAAHVFGWIDPTIQEEPGMTRSGAGPSAGSPAAQMERARRLLAGAPVEREGRGEIGARAPLHLCLEKYPVPGPRCAFLASFTSATTDIVVPLREGRNRVGWGMFGGDFQEPPFAAFFESQWLLIAAGPEVFAASHVGAPATLVLPACSPSYEAFREHLQDEAARADLLARPPQDATVLDRYGRQARALRPGDVLVTRESALVFGSTLS